MRQRETEREKEREETHAVAETIDKKGKGE